MGWRDRILFLCALVGGIVALLKLAPVVGDWASAAFHLVHAEGRPPPALVVSTAIVDRQTEMGLVGGHGVPTRSSAPQVDVWIRNEGSKAVELESAQVDVTAGAQLLPCRSPQGGGPEEAQFERSYFINLPFSPSGEASVPSRPLHQSIAPGGAGEVKLYFRTLEWEALEELYGLRVRLRTTGDPQPVEVGRFVVSLPGSVVRDGAFLPEDRAVLEEAARFDERLESTWCYRRNMALLKRFESLPGRRSDAMKELPSWLPASNWDAFADPAPARRAAVEMLRPETLLGAPILAVFAARTTGDRQFVQRIRKRAIVALLHEAGRSLHPAPGVPRRAIFDASAAIALGGPPAAKQTLIHAEAALRGLEDVSGELSG